MTKPRTVPSTVSIALENTSLCLVNCETSVTTTRARVVVRCGGGNIAKRDSLVATAEKNVTSGQMSLMTVALNFLRLHPAKSGFCATIWRVAGGTQTGCWRWERADTKLLLAVLKKRPRQRRNDPEAASSRLSREQRATQVRQADARATTATPEEGEKGREGTVVKRVSGARLRVIWRLAASRAPRVQDQNIHRNRLQTGSGSGTLLGRCACPGVD